MSSLAAKLRRLFIQIFGVLPTRWRDRHPNLVAWFYTIFPERGTRRLFCAIRQRIGTWLLGEVECSADVYGTRVNLLDDRKYFYYFPFLHGEIYEPALARRLGELFRAEPESTFLDIGAHYGYFTIYAGNVLGTGGSVIAVEPHPEFYRRLLKNITLNGLNGRVRAFNLGLSDREGSARMTGWDERTLQEQANGRVKVLTLDALCAVQGIRPDIVKIDVHGAEGKILSGMRRVLRGEVRHLFCEMHREMQGFTAADLVGLLEQGGLKVVEFGRHREESGGALAPIGPDLLENPTDRVLYAFRA